MGKRSRQSGTFLWKGVELERAAAALLCLFRCPLLAAVMASAPQKGVRGFLRSQPEATGLFSHSTFLCAATLNAVLQPELRATVLAHGARGHVRSQGNLKPALSSGR